MNPSNFINFKKERDLGDMFSDTYTFLKLEWKPFFTTIIKIAFLPILFSIASSIYFLLTFSDFITGMSNLNDIEYYQEVSPNFGMFFISVGVVFVFNFIAYVMINSAALYYIKSYVENQGKIDYNDIKNATTDKFLSFSALYIVSGIIVFTGILFCFLPGIYFAIVLSLSSCILVFFEQDSMNAIGASFTYIKEHWWSTFGILIVTGLIVWLVSIVLQLPLIIYQFTQMDPFAFLDPSDPAEIMNLYKDPVYMILTIFSEIIKFLLIPISLIVSVFIFFDINEQHNH